VKCAGKSSFSFKHFKMFREFIYLNWHGGKLMPYIMRIEEELSVFSTPVN